MQPHDRPDLPSSTPSRSASDVPGATASPGMAPGSRFAVECGPTSIPEAERENVVERMRQASQQWRDHGFDLDFSELVYIGDRNDPGTYLADRGWRVTRRTVDELLADNGRPRPPADDEMGNLGEMAYLTGILGS